MKSIWNVLCVAMVLAGVTLPARDVGADDHPAIIRIAFPSTGVDNRPVVGGDTFSLMDIRAALRNEFKSGTPFSAYKEDWAGTPIVYKASPLIDPYIVARYKQSIEDAKRYGLIRKTFDFDSWVDTSFLSQVLREDHLEAYWQPRAPLH